jgi:hypothetical protein
VSANTRQNPRYALEVDAEVRLGEPDRKVLPIRTRDVSRGGLAFYAPTQIASASEVTISMALVFDEKTFSEPLQVRARVVWCTPFGEGRFQVGTCFLNMTGEQRSYLELFLRYLKEGARSEEPENEKDEKDKDEEAFG